MAVNKKSQIFLVSKIDLRAKEILNLLLNQNLCYKQQNIQKKYLQSSFLKLTVLAPPGMLNLDIMKLSDIFSYIEAWQLLFMI